MFGRIVSVDTTAQAPNAVPTFEVPEPPDRFGQDGGKFYRHYDALADEIDDDMTNGLKEQLDGMLIFAGLFAGVNTAFLALTIPLLSADSTDDTNALILQTNAILMQLLPGGNGTLLQTTALPSADFTASRDIFIFNVLFGLSLALAIMSSFLAVLGRQWLVYYRKRGGGGADRQRWTQLKRFLGAERWGLEAILDDFLPSLLQIGLIIFCAALIVYLRYLSPAMALIVGIPIYLGLAFFAGSALCVLWDAYCPFHSPLSHAILGSVQVMRHIGRAIWMMPQTIREIRRSREMERFESNLTTLPERGYPRLMTRFMTLLLNGRDEESPETLQAIALGRIIRISDDPFALMHATANLLTINEPVILNQIWSDIAFRDRFFRTIVDIYKGRALIPREEVDSRVAYSLKQLSMGGLIHILTIGQNTFVYPLGDIADDENLQNVLLDLRYDVPLETSLIPATRIPFSSSVSIRSSLEILYWRTKEESTLYDEELLRRYVVTLLGTRVVDGNPPPGRLWYRKGWAVRYLAPAFKSLLRNGFEDFAQSEVLLVNIMRCMTKIATEAEVNSQEWGFDLAFQLLEACEVVLHDSRCPTQARQVGREFRNQLAGLWLRFSIEPPPDMLGIGWFAQSYLEFVGRFPSDHLDMVFDSDEHREVIHTWGHYVKEYNGSTLSEAFDTLLNKVNAEDERIRGTPEPNRPSGLERSFSVPPDCIAQPINIPEQEETPREDLEPNRPSGFDFWITESSEQSIDISEKEQIPPGDLDPTHAALQPPAPLQDARSRSPPTQSSRPASPSGSPQLADDETALLGQPNGEMDQDQAPGTA